MRLDAAARAANVKPDNHSILLYGPPKTGKTRLVGTAAKIEPIEKIYWIDCENGSSTLLTMGLSDAELKKFIVYKLPDLRETPRAIEGVLKMLTGKGGVRICDEHGIVNCTTCKPGYAGEDFDLSKCTHNDLVVIDSGSQLGISALNLACLGKPTTYKPLQDDWGSVGKWLTDILLVVQQAQHTNFVVITHEISTEGEDGKERIYPLMGTKNFSSNVGKFFGSIVYTTVKLGAHSAASSSTYKPDLITGSRLNVKLEGIKDPSMKDILVAGGVIK